MSYNEWDKLSSVAVALSLGLDWLFPYVTSYKFGNITFTKFIAIPLVLLSFILQHEKYLKLFFKPTYFVFTICFLFGYIFGIILNNISVSLGLSLLSSVAFFYFFSLKRPVEIIKKVIISLCVSSFIACVVAVFGGLGIIPAIRDEFYISSQQVLFSRTYTGVSSSFLGGFVAILLSSYWLLANKINKKRLVIIAFIMIICFEISFITAQRSIVVMVLMAILVITYIILFRWRKNDYLISLRSFFKKNIISIFLLNLALLSILMILYNSGGGTLGFRVSSTGPQDAAFASRMDVWKYFISDIFTQPNLIGEGDKNILNQIGTGAHSIFVEAYYYGGILMIISLVSCYFIAMKISFSKIKVRSNKEFSIIYMFLFTALILLFFYLLYMPGLYSKIPYVLLGLAFSLSDKK